MAHSLVPLQWRGEMAELLRGRGEMERGHAPALTPFAPSRAWNAGSPLTRATRLRNLLQSKAPRAVRSPVDTPLQWTHAPRLRPAEPPRGTRLQTLFLFRPALVPCTRGQVSFAMGTRSTRCCSSSGVSSQATGKSEESCGHVAQGTKLQRTRGREAPLSRASLVLVLLLMLAQQVPGEFLGLAHANPRDPRPALSLASAISGNTASTVSDIDGDGLLEGAGFEDQELPSGGGDDVEVYRRPGWRRSITLVEAEAISGRRIPTAGGEEEASEPQQVHVSLWGPGRVMVTWITSSPSAESVVEFGTIPGSLDSWAQGNALTYDYLMYSSGLIHRVVLGSKDQPLLPNTTYYYRCGRGSRELAFKTLPDSPPLDVAIVGDLGQTEWSVSTLEHIQQDPYDLLVLPGDLSYADRYQPRWDNWGTLIEPSASSRPWMTVPGNHEIEGIPFLETKHFVAYNARWPMPHGPSPVPSPSPLYYSFESAGVHWLMLASYGADFSPGSEQYKWLEADLAAVDRERTPWLIVALHAPWYNSNYAHQGEGEAMRRSLEEMLYKYRADVLFAGHVHAYERSARVFDNKLDPCGIVHITIGDGGNREGLATKYYEPQPDWSVRREASFGHGELRFHADGSADWLWHRNQDEPESVVADSVRLYPHALDQGKRARKLGPAVEGEIVSPACPVLQ